MSRRRNMRFAQEMLAQPPVELPPESPAMEGCYEAPCPPNMVEQERIPDLLIDRPLGDAGAGLPRFRTTQYFWQVQASAVAPNAFTTPHVLATARSYDRRIRLWQINISGRDVVRENVAAQNPAQFSTLIPNLGADATQATAVKARIEIQNQSGRVFQDVDVLGSRSIQVYAWAVTVFALLPVNGFEVQPTDTRVANATFTGVVSDSIFGAQISPTVVNSTQVPDQVSRFVVVPLNTEILIPTPPGAREVEIHSVTTPFPANVFQFDTGAPVGTANPTSLGIITFPAASTSTGFLRIPNALAIRVGGVGQPGGDYSLVYTVEK